MIRPCIILFVHPKTIRVTSEAAGIIDDTGQTKTGPEVMLEPGEAALIEDAIELILISRENRDRKLTSPPGTEA